MYCIDTKYAFFISIEWNVNKIYQIIRDVASILWKFVSFCEIIHN